MKKLIAFISTLSISLTVMSGEARGVFGVENPEKYLLVLGSGFASEAYQVGIAYDLQFRCIVPYTKGEWANRSWGMRINSDMIGKDIKVRTTFLAEKLFAEEKLKRLDICETDYKNEIALDPEALAKLNYFAEATYNRLGHMASGSNRDELKLSSTDPVAICLDDVKLIEYLNVIVSSCK